MEAINKSKAELLGMQDEKCLKGPRILDFDEHNKIGSKLILEPNHWIPCVALPTRLSMKQVFRQVSCGSHHTVAVSQEGEVFACGLSTKGRLGLS